MPSTDRRSQRASHILQKKRAQENGQCCPARALPAAPAPLRPASSGPLRPGPPQSPRAPRLHRQRRESLCSPARRSAPAGLCQAGRGRSQGPACQPRLAAAAGSRGHPPHRGHLPPLPASAAWAPGELRGAPGGAPPGKHARPRQALPSGSSSRGRSSAPAGACSPRGSRPAASPRQLRWRAVGARSPFSRAPSFPEACVTSRCAVTGSPSRVSQVGGGCLAPAGVPPRPE